MKRRCIHILSFAIVFLLLSVLASGCGGNQQADQGNTQAKEATVTASAATTAATATTAAGDPNAMEWKANTSPVKFTAYIDIPENAWDGWGTDAISREITQRTGVTIDIKDATTSDSQQLNAMMASGEIPDFVIYDAGKAVRNTLWKQGFVLPLNKLMDQYAPNMWKILPKDEDKIYTESDGNLYLLTSYFADIDRNNTLQGTITNKGALAINEPMYDKLGNPPYKTLADYKALLMTAREKLSGVKFLAYDGAVTTPQDGSTNMAQLINRVYGGTDTKAIGADGTVHLNFRDDTYLKAVLYINDLYRSKLFDPENFTTTQENQFSQLAKNQQIFSYWGQGFNIYKYDMSEKGPYKDVEPPQEPGIPFKIQSGVSQIGGGESVSISKNCKNPDRAIQYLEFLVSDEGQMLTYHGVEGKDYTLEEGYPKNSQEKTEAWKDFATMQKTMGIINYQVCWIPSIYTDGLYYYWLNQGIDAYKVEMEVYNKYSNDERMNALTKVASDSPEQVLETKIFQLWKESLPKMYLAESQEECTAAYKGFNAQADKLGAARLEKAYTDSYQMWKQKLGK